MQVGISTASLFLRRNNEEALPLFSEWGVPCAEVFLTSFCEYAPSFAEQLAANRGTTRIHSVHVLNTQYEPQLYAEHPRVLSDAYGWLEQVMQSAKIMGAKHYTFHGIARLKRTFRENFPRFAAETKKIFNYALPCSGFPSPKATASYGTISVTATRRASARRKMWIPPMTAT